MEYLKEELKRDARRHSNKLIAKMEQIIDVPVMVQDSIHQEILYATMDGYRTTMKLTRNGETENDNTQERTGNR